MGKSIIINEYGNESKYTVKEYIEQTLCKNDHAGIAESAAENAEAAQKGLSVLCQLLTNNGLLTAKDILNIAGDYERDCKLTDDD